MAVKVEIRHAEHTTITSLDLGSKKTLSMTPQPQYTRGVKPTTEYDTKKTADYSPLVVHFTTGRRMVRANLISEGTPLFAYRTSTALERLRNILSSRTIYASPMPFLPHDMKAVCFSECIWEGLISLANQYSPYGIVFNKRLIFTKGGGPALYIRGDLLRNLGTNVPETIEPFVAPFDPYEVLRRGTPLDFLHEREWRLSTDLNFEYQDIQYILVQTIDDARAIVHSIGSNQLPEDKFLPIDVSRKIKEAWTP
jgi:hypothetical protein